MRTTSEGRGGDALVPSSRDAYILHWILRIGVVMEFIGHGTFGFYQKPIFAKYLDVVGLGTHAHTLRPLIGTHDYLLALIVLVWPNRAILLWATLWGLWTSLLRPLSGEQWWEFVERSYNFGGPFALFLVTGPLIKSRDFKTWLSRVSQWQLSPETSRFLALTLRVVVAALLIGHGGFGAFMHKDILRQQWAAIGLHTAPFGLGPMIRAQGWFEIALGVAALLRPSPPLLLLFSLWKIGTEALYPITGLPAFHPLFEFIERGGAYACPLALAYLLLRVPRRNTVSAIATMEVQVEPSPRTA